MSNQDNISIKDTILLSVQPISIILFLYVTNGKGILEAEKTFMTIFSMILIIISNIISFYIFQEIIRKNSIEKELEYIKTREKEQEIYYDNLKKNIYSFKSYRHDLKHHFSILNSMIYFDKITEAKEFIKNLNHALIEISDTSCGDHFLDLVLSSRLYKLKVEGITMTYEIRKINLSHINDLDLNIIYSNILDNAIEACMKCDNKYIIIKMMKINQKYQVIKFINSCYYVKQNAGKFVSLKNNKDHHGFGLMNVKQTVEKYGGVVQYSFKKEKKEFETTIIFKNNSKS